MYDAYVHTDYIINWGANSNDYYNFYVMSDDNINNLYYICTDQNDPTIKYYYIPTVFSDIVQNIIEQDPSMAYEYYYTFPGSGTPLSSMTVTLDYSPESRGPISGTFTVPTFLAFEGVSNVATTSELDNSYTHNQMIYQKKAILSVGGTNGVFGYVESAFYYDYLGRVIQTVEKNHLGGISRTSMKYDLAGNILSQHEAHKPGPGLNADVKLSTFTYDDRGRMLTETTSINGGTSGTVTYAYNELGQLTGKSYGNGATEALAYNIQGWLSSKNAARSGTNIFSMNLLYYNSTRATNKFTGNIVEWQWTQGTDSQNSYALSYDKLSRLTNSARYVGGVSQNAFTEQNLLYDKNGNITQLQRYGTSNSTLQDNFTYSYSNTGNRLNSISGSVSATYAYDNNGNMTTDGRKNLVISYNVLNLQQRLTQSGTTMADYTYLSDGTKCGVVDNSNSGYDYLGSLIYTRSGSTRTFESAGFGGGSIIYASGTYSPYYYITDHLGSTRAITNNSGTVVERNDYYPFGGKHANASYPQLTVNRQKFNGKELQTTGNTGFLDYGARMYDDVIGRWGVVDPMGEKANGWSPYRYGYNNPVTYFDPTGMLESTHTDEDGYVIAVYDDGDNGVYKHDGKGEEAVKTVENNYNENNTSAGGEKMGESLHSLSFADQSLYNKTGKVKAANIQIDFGSNELTDKVQGILDVHPSLREYASKAGVNGAWDLKSNTKNGSLLYGKYASPRDAGNFTAGTIAQKSGIEPVVQFGFGAYNMTGNNQYLTGLVTVAVGGLTFLNPALGIGTAYLIGKYGEDKLSQRSINIGKKFIKNK